MAAQIKAATIRGLHGPLFTAMSTFFVTFSDYMGSRGIAEDLIDSNRGPTKANVGLPSLTGPRRYPHRGPGREFGSSV